MKRLFFILMAGALLATIAQTAHAKPFEVVVGFTAGGNADVEARVWAEAAERHAGHPVIVINRPGAGGILAANIFANGDGDLGYFTDLLTALTLQPKMLTVKRSDFKILATAESRPAVLYGRAGLNPFTDTVFAGGVGVGSGRDLRMRLALDIMRIPHIYVPYKGANSVRVAFGRGEINLSDEALTLVPEGGQVLWSFPLPDGSPNPLAKDVPTFMQVHAEQWGGQPAGPLWDALLGLTAASTTYVRTLVVRTNTPAEEVDRLRRLITAVAKDPQFIAKATSVLGYVPAYRLGEPNFHMDAAAQKLLKDMVERP